MNHLYEMSKERNHRYRMPGVEKKKEKGGVSTRIFILFFGGGGVLKLAIG